MLARVLAMGPYHEDLQGVLQYLHRHYRPEHAGSIVFRTLFECSGERAVRLATALGISDPLDFAQHQFDPLTVKAATLADFDCPFGLDLESFLELRKKRYRFHFFYQPEG